MKNHLNLKLYLSIFFTSFLLLFSSTLLAQFEHAKFNLGFETGGSIIVPAKRANGTIPNFWKIRTAPFINFRLGKSTFVGLTYENQIGKLDGESLEPLNGFGIHARQYFNVFKRDFTKDRFQLYGELGYFRLDYLVDEEALFGVQKLPEFSNQQIQFIAGMNVRLFSSLYLNYGLRPIYYTQGKDFQFSNRLGLEYHFKEKRKVLPKRIKPVKEKSETKDGVFDFSYFLKRATVGTSFTYIFDQQDFLPSYKEKTWNFNIATSLTNDLDFGLAYLTIKVEEANLTDRRHYLVGGFFQYDFLRNFEGNRFFIESGLYKGNLCSCGDENPYYEPDLNYISYGAGFDWKFSDRLPLTLDLSFLWYRVLNQEIEDRWAISQYVVGLNYRFY